jgi:hypothetical protein
MSISFSHHRFFWFFFGFKKYIPAINRKWEVGNSDKKV